MFFCFEAYRMALWAYLLNDLMVENFYRIVQLTWEWDEDIWGWGNRA